MEQVVALSFASKRLLFGQLSVEEEQFHFLCNTDGITHALPLKKIQPVVVQVEVPSSLLGHLDRLLLASLVAVGVEDFGVPRLLSLVLHASLPTDAIVPREPVHTVLFRAI